MIFQDIFTEMENLRREIDDVFRDVGARWSLDIPYLPGFAARGFPPVNLSEDEDNFYALALLPGLAAESIDLQVTQRTLTISGERNGGKAPEGASWYRRERERGTFHRVVELPTPINTERLEASYRDGLLRITLPKAEAARTKKITIKNR